MRTLLIDDLRTFKADRTCRTFGEGLEALDADGPWDLLILDHDLGEVWDARKTGYGILEWLDAHPEKLPGRVQVVTMNVPARLRMEQILMRYYRQEDGQWIR